MREGYALLPLRPGGPRSVAWTGFRVHLRAGLWVGRYDFIPVSGRSVLGGPGCVRAPTELHRQAQGQGVGPG